ncbi:hypothetical protein ERJ75_001133400 [Trypanosoma vivax]|nr:hypothetical protein ERJ75_001133400 [Trypanosoma vivax]
MRLPRDAKDNTNTWPRRTQTRREETPVGTQSSSAQRRRRSMAPRESGTNWPPGWKTQDERTSTGTRGERLVEKNSGAKDGAKGVAHDESPASRRTGAQVGRMVERGQSDKGKRGTATQTWGHARKEILRRLTRNTGHSQRGTATQPAAASATGTRGGAEAKRGLRRRWSEQRRECSTEERPKKGARRVVMSKAADEQGAKVTQQWRLNGKGAQGDALPCDRWRSEGREETPHGGCLRGRAESDNASTLPLAGACNHVQQPADSIERHAWSSPRDAAARQSHCGQENGRTHRLPSEVERRGIGVVWRTP